MIPRRLIRCVPRDVPEEFEAFWLAWQELHPRWQFITIQDPIDPCAFPLLGFLHARCTSGAQLAGLIRLEAVHEVGGVYVDMDVEPLRPIDELLCHPLFIGTEDGLHLTDAMFGAEADHPGLRACIDRLRASDPPIHAGAQITGPLLTTDVLSGRDDVTVLARRLLYPYSYTEKHRRREDFSGLGGYAVHHWNFSWATT